MLDPVRETGNTPSPTTSGSARARGLNRRVRQGITVGCRSRMGKQPGREYFSMARYWDPDLPSSQEGPAAAGEF